MHSVRSSLSSGVNTGSSDPLSPSLSKTKESTLLPIFDESEGEEGRNFFGGKGDGKEGGGVLGGGGMFD